MREPPTLVAVDRGNGSLVGVTQRSTRGLLIGFACPATPARPADRAYDETQRHADEIRITIPVQRHGDIVQQTYLLNPAPEDLASSDLASVGDVEFATPIYVAQHLSVIGMQVGQEVQHVELVFRCPFNCWADERSRSFLLMPGGCRRSLALDAEEDRLAWYSMLATPTCELSTGLSRAGLKQVSPDPQLRIS